MQYSFKPDEQINGVIIATTEKEAKEVQENESCYILFSPEIYESWTGYAMGKPIWVFGVIG